MDPQYELPSGSVKVFSWDRRAGEGDVGVPGAERMDAEDDRVSDDLGVLGAEETGEVRAAVESEEIKRGLLVGESGSEVTSAILFQVSEVIYQSRGSI